MKLHWSLGTTPRGRQTEKFPLFRVRDFTHDIPEIQELEELWFLLVKRARYRPYNQIGKGGRAWTKPSGSMWKVRGSVVALMPRGV